MPTIVGMILLALLVVGAVAGLVVWARQQSMRNTPPSLRGRGGRDAPYDGETAVAQNLRHQDRNGFGL